MERLQTFDKVLYIAPDIHSLRQAIFSLLMTKAGIDAALKTTNDLKELFVEQLRGKSYEDEMGELFEISAHKLNSKIIERAEDHILGITIIREAIEEGKSLFYLRKQFETDQRFKDLLNEELPLGFMLQTLVKLCPTTDHFPSIGDRNAVVWYNGSSSLGTFIRELTVAQSADGSFAIKAPYLDELSESVLTRRGSRIIPYVVHHTIAVPFNPNPESPRVVIFERERFMSELSEALRYRIKSVQWQRSDHEDSVIICDTTELAGRPSNIALVTGVEAIMPNLTITNNTGPIQFCISRTQDLEVDIAFLLMRVTSDDLLFSRDLARVSPVIQTADVLKEFFRSWID